MNEEPGHFGVLRMRRNPWVMGAALSPILLGLALLVGGLAMGSFVAFFSLHAFALGLVGARYAWLKNPWPRFEETTVEVRPDSLVVGEEVVPRADLSAGFVVRGVGDATVKLKRKGLRPDLDLVVASPERGWELLRALGLAPTQTTTEVRGASLLHATVGRQILGSLVLTVTFFTLAFGLGALLGGAGAGIGGFAGILLLLMGQLWPSYTRVGADGVRLRWLAYDRFIPHESIASVAAREVGWGNNRRQIVRLVLTSGERLDIPVTVNRVDGDGGKLLAQRIEEAMEIHRSQVPMEDDALLVRGGRSVADWRRALETLTERASHRAAAVDLARLWEFVEGTGYRAESRAAAAVALRPHLAPEDRERLRVASETVAHPKLRVALAAVADEAAEAELEAALEELEPDEQAKRQPSR
ncbi:MAG: hypothetical protein R3B72_33940 [Polyangiaceae bacterium]